MQNMIGGLKLFTWFVIHLLWLCQITITMHRCQRESLILDQVTEAMSGSSLTWFLLQNLIPTRTTSSINSPEAWVKFQNPCDSQYPKGGSFADVVLRTLNPEESDDEQQQQIVTMNDFDSIVQDCLSLYRATDRLKHSNFLAHLLRCDPPEGLRLATAEMTIQGHDNGGDILRMASNIRKLEQAQQYIQQQTSGSDPAITSYNKELQVFTMSLDEFIARPASSALEFFDFVLGNNRNDLIRQRKEAVALQYENHYYEKLNTGVNQVTNDRVSHITHDRNNDREQLMEYLRSDSVFGPPLQKIEALVETTLASRWQQGGLSK